MNEQSRQVLIEELQTGRSLVQLRCRAMWLYLNDHYPDMSLFEKVDAIVEAFGYSESHRYRLYREARQHSTKVFS